MLKTGHIPGQIEIRFLRKIIFNNLIFQHSMLPVLMVKAVSSLVEAVSLNSIPTKKQLFLTEHFSPSKMTLSSVT